MNIKKNKVYMLGAHRIICGDCRDAGIVKELVGEDKIKLIVADPPYGVSYVQNKKGFVKIKKDIEIENDNVQSESSYKEFSLSWLKQVALYLDAKNSCYIFNSDKMLFCLKEAMDVTGFRLAQLLIWVKNNQVIGRRDYLARHELIVYGWYGTHAFYKSKDKSVLFFSRPNASSLHPTSKPVALIRHLILNSSQIGDTIYDPFGGSGTTLIACEATARRCLLVEIDPQYIKTTIDRFNRLKGK